MSKWLFLLMLLTGVSLQAQDVSQTVLLSNGTPTGACPARKLDVDYLNSLLYFCSNSAWVLTTSAGGAGTVTSVATTAPITGGTITTTGTIACATCVKSAAALTSGGVVLGAGLQASAVDANLNWSSPALTIGVATSTTGLLKLTGATSGTAIITPQAASGSPTITIPNASGTMAVSASSPLALSATTGALTCATCATTAAGGAITLDQVGSPGAAASFTVTAANTVTLTGSSNATLTMLALTNSSAGNAAYNKLIFNNASANASLTWAGHSNSTDADTLYLHSDSKLITQSNNQQFASSGGSTIYGGFDTSGNLGVGTNATMTSDALYINNAGLIKKYNNIATAGNGMSSIIYSNGAAAAVAAVSDTTMVTPGADTNYLFDGWINCTTASAAATATLNIKFTDTGSFAQTFSPATALATCTTLGTASIAYFTVPFRAKSSVAVTYGITIANTPTFDYFVRLKTE